MSTYLAAQPQDPIEELFEDVFRVQGSLAMGPGLRINRNMAMPRQVAVERALTAQADPNLSD